MKRIHPLTLTLFTFSCASFLQGCNHNRGAIRQNGDNGFAHGYRDPDEQFRTIMSYDCDNEWCPRIQRFSTNDSTVQHKGLSVGDDYDNNVLQINNTKQIVANFRKSVPKILPLVAAPICKKNYVYFSVEVTTDGDASEISWDLTNRKQIKMLHSSDFQSISKVSSCLWSGNCYTFQMNNSGNTNRNGEYKVYADGKVVGSGSSFDATTVHSFSLDARKNKFDIGSGKMKGCRWLRQKTNRITRKKCQAVAAFRSGCPATCNSCE